MNYGSADEDYIIKVSANDAEVERLRAAIDKEEAALRKTMGALGGYSTAQLQADASVKAHAASLQALGAQLNQVQAAAGVSAQKFLNLGRMLDDLQYVPQQGLRPIINNVMEMAPAIGIAMIAVQALIQNWSALAEVFGMGATKTEAEAMEELGKKTSRTADEEERLYRFKQLNAKVAEQATAQTKSEKDTTAAVDKAVVDFGQLETEGLVKKHDAATVAGMTARENEDLDDARKGRVRTRHDGDPDSFAWLDRSHGRVKTPIQEAAIEEAKRKLADAEDIAAKKIIAAASIGKPGAREHLINVSKKDPNASALTEGLEAASPEARTKQKVEKAWDKLVESISKGFEKAVEKEAKKEDKETHHAETAFSRGVELSNQDDERFNKEELAKTKKAEHEAKTAKKEKHHEDMHRVEETGFGGYLAKAFEAHAAAGGNLDAAEKAEVKRLTPSLGKEVATETVHKSRMEGERGAWEEVIGKASKVSHSETIGSADFAKKIQAGVSNEASVMKRLVALNAAMDASLKLIARNTVPKPPTPQVARVG